jgi:hypothetical protein
MPDTLPGTLGQRLSNPTGLFDLELEEMKNLKK